MKKTFSQILIVTFCILTITLFSNCESKKDKVETSQEEKTEQQSQKVETNIEVSDDEITTFIQASIMIQDTENEFRTASINLVKNSDMGIERFQEISQLQNAPNQDQNVSKEEMQEFDALTAELQEIQMDAQENAENIIEQQGMDTDRYRTISMASQRDSDLQQRLQQEYMKQKEQTSQQP